MLAAAIATYLTIGALYGLLLVLRLRQRFYLTVSDFTGLVVMMTVAHPIMIYNMMEAVPDDMWEDTPGD